MPSANLGIERVEESKIEFHEIPEVDGMDEDSAKTALNGGK